jgi:hypothetical protein
MHEFGPSVLGYASPRKAGLALEERDGQAVVTFPVAPKWVYVLSIASQLFVCLANLGGAALPVVFLFRFRPPFVSSLVYAIFSWAFGALFWGSMGLHSWLMYRRWGRVPRELTADENGLVLSWLGWRRMRERRWPADEISGIDLRVIRGHLNPWRTVAILYVRRRKGMARRFRLSSADPELPHRIARRLSEILGRPLNCRS